MGFPDCDFSKILSICNQFIHIVFEKDFIEYLADQILVVITGFFHILCILRSVIKRG